MLKDWINWITQYQLHSNMHIYSYTLSANQKQSFVFVFLIKSILFIIVSQGDSGGPLYMRYIIDGQKKSAYFDNSKPWYLLGIVSFGTKKCGSGNPAIYTRQVMLINISQTA